MHGRHRHRNVSAVAAPRIKITHQSFFSFVVCFLSSSSSFCLFSFLVTAYFVRLDAVITFAISYFLHLCIHLVVVKRHDQHVFNVSYLNSRRYHRIFSSFLFSVTPSASSAENERSQKRSLRRWYVM